MKFTLSSLKGFLKTTATTNEIINALNSIGFEVEDVQDLAATYEPYIVAEILETSQHENAERLKVCKVNNGSEVLQIVCGASNARAGIKVVLAPVGTYVAGIDVTIKKSMIRGVESNGMLCSEDELMLAKLSEGILELSADHQVGEKFSKAAGLNEVIIDIDITPNRGDAISVYGIARDLAAKGVGVLNPYEVVAAGSSSIAEFTINNEVKDSCYEFLAVAIKGVDNTRKVQEFRRQLALLGSADNGALVDISNYLMLQYGRPNHIYDLDKIDGSLTIRMSKEEEEFIAIGGERYNLPAGLMVIADHSKICCVAGVIGGELSKVDADTKNILVEVATFASGVVAKAGRALNIITDSRYRFERRVDTGITQDFINILIATIVNNLGGQASSIIAVPGNLPKYPTEVIYDYKYFKQLIGIDVAEETQQQILEALGFKVQGNKIIVPSYRYGDIASKQDLVEEIVRIYGYEKVESTKVQVGALKGVGSKCNPRKRLAGRGLDEIISWSFYSQARHDLFGFNEAVRIDNPISQDLAMMRCSLLATMVDAVSLNERRSFDRIAFFELGKVYHSLDCEQDVIAGLRYGKFQELTSLEKERKVNFYDAKADCFAVIEELGFDPEKLAYERSAPSYYHPGRAVAMKLGKNIIAYIGEIHPRIKEELKLADTTVAFEVFVNNIPPSRAKVARPALQLSELQEVKRDFAFIFDDGIEAADICRTVAMVDKALIAEVTIFDVFKDQKIDNGKKSIALRVRMQPKEKTLVDAEITAISERIIKAVEHNLKGTIRV